MIKFDLNTIDWQKMNDLVPAIIQDENTSQVLMLGYMNQAALQQTLETGRVTFYSRSKQRLWVKGETSSHFLNLVDLCADCDNDCLLILAKPQGPTCHLGNTTCFDAQPSTAMTVLSKLTQTIQSRYDLRPENSYTTTLFDEGINRIAQKVGEEGVEVALAAVTEPNETLCNEIADLLFHLLVLLQAKNLTLADVIEVLATRMSSNR